MVNQNWKIYYIAEFKAGRRFSIAEDTAKNPAVVDFEQVDMMLYRKGVCRK